MARLGTVVVTEKNVKKSTAFAVNGRKMDLETRFSLFHVVKFETTKIETWGPLYRNLIRSQWKLRIMYSYDYCTFERRRFGAEEPGGYPSVVPCGEEVRSRSSSDAQQSTTLCMLPCCTKETSTGDGSATHGHSRASSRDRLYRVPRVLKNKQINK